MLIFIFERARVEISSTSVGDDEYLGRERQNQENGVTSY